ncbi:MAG: acetyl-CoA C-acetyltransferase [Lachnospiraceae bacterium]|nr:acetyl-CoA C-acetyltransferase [Lachnospiraceae bacterium]
MKKAVITGACRTAIGKMGGALSTTSSAELAAIVIREALRRSGVNPDAVDMVYVGCVLQAAQGQNIARQASVMADLPYGVPAVTINAVCGSGLEAVNEAARMVRTGEAEVVVAAGTENMSMAPYALTQARFGYKMNDQTLVDTMVRDALWDVFNDCHMITTADNICREWHLTREELDAFALRSQKRAIHAIKTGKFVKEIVPVTVQRKKESFLFQTDEGPRESTMEGLSALKPVFPDGFVTAGNASGINDGAAAVVVMSEDYAKDLRIRPMATFVTSALAGVRPDIMGIGPVASTEKLLDRTGFKIGDFDVIEANEAFAAQSIAVAKELHIDTERQLNPNGGAIALGHPVGASGCRILVTLLHEMQERDLHLGLATLCIGGGMGCSTIVRRERT